MKIWHKDLISQLPNSLLRQQWLEILKLKSRIIKGQPLPGLNHYNYIELWTYIRMVTYEMRYRGLNFSKVKKFELFSIINQLSIKPLQSNEEVDIDQLFNQYHDSERLRSDKDQLYQNEYYFKE